MDHPSTQVPPEPPQPANVANAHELSRAAHEELRSNNERLKLGSATLTESHFIM